MPQRSRPGLAIVALLVLSVAADPAAASRAPTAKESRAIKRTFFMNHERSSTRITRVRVSTADKRFAAVHYTADVRDPEGPAARAAKVYKPVPDTLKKASGGRWKDVPPSKASKAAKKDLEVRAPRSEIRITGEVEATLTRAARCRPGGGPASIYDPGTDVWLSIQFHQDVYKGPGHYPALGLGSLAGIYGNSASQLLYQTGQSSDYRAPTGEIYIDGGGWGIIEATMARVNDGTDTHHPQSVVVSGTWTCG